MWHRRLAVVPAALAAACLLSAVVAGPAAAAPTPATPSTVAGVTSTLTTLSQQNEQLTEQFNAATIEVAAKQQAAAAAKTAASTAAAQWQVALKQYGSTIAEQFKTSSLSRAGALLTSTNAQNYLDTVSDLDAVSQHNSAVVTKLTAAKTAATTAQATATTTLAQATVTRDALAKQRADLAQQQVKYQALLATLSVPQQQTYFGKDTAVVPATFDVHAGSAAAQAAIDFALAQRGKPYVYGSGGPSSFDCSGLTAAAYRAAGVSLPHNAAAQYGYGTHVSLSELQPGDLVFFYSPIGHVGLYLGNGLMIHAPTSGDVVKVSPIFSGATGATRLT